MLRLLTAIGSLISAFTIITTGSEARSLTGKGSAVRWSVAVKAHNPFDNWT
ncbi:MAG: hypothetical protein ACRD23_15165 [Terriglobales bacterium]